MNGMGHGLGVCASAILGLALMLQTAPVVAQSAAGTGAFPKVGEIEKQLKRGVSTTTDVQRVLGVPNGYGGALLPGFGEKSEQVDAYQVWFYQDIEITNLKSGQDVWQMLMRQQILGVFFKGKVFHGYVWTSNDGDLQVVR